MARPTNQAPAAGEPNRSRLVPPTSRVAMLPRPDLVDLLVTAAASTPVLLVCAGAGYGKTELAAAVHSVIQADGLLVPCWYSLDTRDRDVGIFLTQLAAALMPVCPSLAQKLDALLRATAGLGLTRPSAELVAEEVAAAQPLEVLVILDDIHHAAESEEIRELLEALLDAQPPNLHVLLSTRHHPRLGPLPRLRATGRVVELGEEELRLSADETTRLLRDVYELELTVEQARTLHARTEGWVAGLQLVQQHLRRQAAGGASPPLTELPHTHTELFDYLGTEVFHREPEELQALLVRSSVLDELFGPLCDHVLGVRGSAALLEEAHDRRLFLQRFEGGMPAYRVHSLFRDFLRRRLEVEEGEDGVQRLHARAATWLRGHGREDQAIHHLMLAGAVEAAGALLADTGRELLRAGLRDQVEQWLDAIPDSVKDTHPWLWVHRGRAAYLHNQASAPFFDRAIKGFESNGDEEGMSTARVGKARALYRLGRYEDVIALASQTLQTLQPHQRAEMGDLFILLGFCAAETTDLHAAERYLDRALVIFQQTGDRQEQARVLDSLAKVYFPQGRFREATSAGHRALADAARTILPIVHIKLGQAHRLLGEHAAAREQLEATQALCRQRDIPLIDCFALCLEADLLLDEGDTAGAGRLYQQAQGFGQQLGEPHMRIAPWLDMGRVHRAEGRFAQALRSQERALAIAEELGYAWFVGVTLGELAGTHLAAGELDRAALCLEQAAAHLRPLDARYELAVCDLRQAWLRRQLGQDDFLEPFERCLLAAQSEGYEYLLLERESAVALPLLREALTAGLHTAFVARLLAGRGRLDLVQPLLDDPVPAVRLRAVETLLRMGGPGAMKALSAVRRDPEPEVSRAVADALVQLSDPGPPTLRVRTLGAFEVWRGDEAIDARDWGGQRVKDLFKLLVLHLHEPLVRDVILDVLWPDFPPDAAANNLNVALSGLRRVLEPWLGPREPSRYLVAADGAYRLDTQAPVHVDAVAFTDLARESLELRAAKKWEETIAACNAALAVYRGELLPENRYDDWAAPERERLSGLYEDVLVVLARALAEQDRLEEACHACRQALRAQPFAEQVHRSLMTYLARLGRRAEALHQFDECRRLLKDELGLPVSTETTSLLTRIKSGESV